MTVLAQWLRERQGQGVDPVFPTRTGRRLSADAVQRRLTLYAATVSKITSSLAREHLTPRVLRYTTAKTLLTAGVDTAIIAPWLGHAGEAQEEAEGIAIRGDRVGADCGVTNFVRQVPLFSGPLNQSARAAAVLVEDNRESGWPTRPF